LKNGSLPWRPELAAAGAALRADAAGSDVDDLAAAVDAVARAEFETFLKGVRAYQAHGYRRDVTDPPVLWRDGATRVLDYGDDRGDGGAGAPPVLLVPSLVNRGYILDLHAKRSLARSLAAEGLRPLLVDWGAPGPAERDFTLTDYIERLEGALDALPAGGKKRAGLVGYCMGGLLALALAQRRQEAFGAMALLATPWDFHAVDGGRVAQYRAMAAQAAWIVDACGELPVDVIQAMFALIDPYRVTRKFCDFAFLEPRSAAARDFVALEDWLNDGVPLVAPVARECLRGWYAENRPARGAWRVGGTPVRPGDIALPALVMVPERDFIVPPESARPLAEALPAGECRTVSAGHIGMVAGRGARNTLYRPLATWLRDSL
jgi:polyhydroxyalkanoate synthase